MNLGTRAITYTYDSVSGHDTSRLKTVSEGTLTVNHDTAGNEVLYGATGSAYSARNYLASTGITSFGYDARGLRVVELTTTGSSLYTITPCRIFDTRNPTGPYGGPSIGAGATRAFTIWGQCGIPATGPQAIALNLTAVNPPVGGNLTLFPSDVAFPGTSSISVKTGVTRANNAVIGLSAAGSLSLNNGLTSSIDMVLDVSGYFIAAPPAARYFFYTPEMNLLAETGITPNGTTPATLYEYIWFGGRPVGQETVGSSTTRWTMTDHLGTPFLQMDSTKAVTWRAEYEPFGRVYAYTTGSSSDPQPLRFPGQEERGTSPSRSYNIYRWYRSDNGNYTQPDAAGLAGDLNLHRYSADDPIRSFDPFGLCRVEIHFSPVGPSWAHAFHAYITTTDNSGTSFFRGGPSQGGGSSAGASGGASGGSCCRSSGGSSNSSNGSSPGSGRGGPGRNNGPFGPIVGSGGPYLPGTVDYPQPGEVQPEPIVLVDTSPCACNTCFQNVLNDIEARQIPYNPFLWNSNSVVHEALQRCGFNSSPQRYWTPAWNNTLPR